MRHILDNDTPVLLADGARGLEAVLAAVENLKNMGFGRLLGGLRSKRALRGPTDHENLSALWDDLETWSIIRKDGKTWFVHYDAGDIWLATEDHIQDWYEV